MLSYKAARSIIHKLLDQHGNAEGVIEWASRASNRSGPIFGVSKRKRKALRAWKRYEALNPRLLQKWRSLGPNEFRQEICSIWGFGSWSADMIGIFHIGRLDIWPEADKGLQKASRLVFGTKSLRLIRAYVKGNETLAALYLWDALNRNVN
jgi:DNA-3-methyladenine glycosylase II